MSRVEQRSLGAWRCTKPVRFAELLFFFLAADYIALCVPLLPVPGPGDGLAISPPWYTLFLQLVCILVQLIAVLLQMPLFLCAQGLIDVLPPIVLLPLVNCLSAFLWIYFVPLAIARYFPSQPGANT